MSDLPPSERFARVKGGHISDVPNCYYCGRPLAQVATDGCGSREIAGANQERINALCEVYDRARRGVIAPTPRY